MAGVAGRGGTVRREQNARDRLIDMGSEPSIGMIDTYVERFEHPYLFALVPVGAVLFGLALVAHGVGWDFGAGFLTLYAIVMFVICSIGYLAFASLKFTTQGLRWWRIRGAGDEVEDRSVEDRSRTAR